MHTTTYAYESGRNAMTVVDNQLSGGSSSVSTYTYTYNALGQRAEREQSGTAFSATTKDTFSYDYLGQVTASANDTETGDAYNPTYAYDEIGNRAGNTVDLNGTTGYTQNLLNQYSTISASSAVNPTYDDDGNLTSDGATWTYTWNGENRLIKADNGTLSIDFEYDYQGRIVKKDDGTNVSIYIYDGWNRIFEISNPASQIETTTSFLWGMDLSGSMQGAGGVGGLLKEGSLYPTYDANGNIVQKLNSSGGTAMSVAYDPFGNVIDGSLVGEYGFSTKPLVGGIQWYYYGFRYYDPVTGRWPSRDPIEEQGGFNLYGFVGNDPVNEIDVLGTVTLQDARDSLERTGDEKLGRNQRGRKVYSDQQVFDRWFDLELVSYGSGWTSSLPRCPRKLCVRTSASRRNGGGQESAENPDSSKWLDPERAGGAEERLHPGAYWSMRSRVVGDNHANQCIYTSTGRILTVTPSAGTADFRQGGVGPNLPGHWAHDVAPVVLAGKLDGNAIDFGAIGFTGSLSSMGPNLANYYLVRPSLVESK